VERQDSTLHRTREFLYLTFKVKYSTIEDKYIWRINLQNMFPLTLRWIQTYPTI